MEGGAGATPTRCSPSRSNLTRLGLRAVQLQVFCGPGPRHSAVLQRPSAPFQQQNKAWANRAAAHTAGSADSGSGQGSLEARRRRRWLGEELWHPACEDISLTELAMQVVTFCVLCVPAGAPLCTLYAVCAAGGSRRELRGRRAQTVARSGRRHRASDSMHRSGAASLQKRPPLGAAAAAGGELAAAALAACMPLHVPSSPHVLLAACALKGMARRAGLAYPLLSSPGLHRQCTLRSAAGRLATIGWCR